MDSKQIHRSGRGRRARFLGDTSYLPSPLSQDDGYPPAAESTTEAHATDFPAGKENEMVIEFKEAKRGDKDENWKVGEEDLMDDEDEPMNGKEEGKLADDKGKPLNDNEGVELADDKDKPVNYEEEGELMDDDDEDEEADNVAERLDDGDEEDD